MKTIAIFCCPGNILVTAEILKVQVVHKLEGVMSGFCVLSTAIMPI